MIANGLMMNGADTLSMSLYDYSAAIHCWSAIHSSDDEAIPEISDAAAREMEAEAEAIDWDNLKVETNGNS